MYPAAIDPDMTEWVAPIISGSGAAVVAIIVGAFAIWNRRKGNVETKAPSVAEIWAREERQSRRAQWLQNSAWRIQAAFRGYSARVRAGGPFDLSVDEQSALDLDLSDDD